MKITPILTEKSLNLAKNGVYTFWVSPFLNKNEIKMAVGEVFGVHVTRVRTINYKKSVSRNNRGRNVVVAARKKGLVMLKKDEKIDAFEVKKEKGKK